MINASPAAVEKVGAKKSKSAKSRLGREEGLLFAFVTEDFTQLSPGAPGRLFGKAAGRPLAVKRRGALTRTSDVPGRFISDLRRRSSNSAGERQLSWAKDSKRRSMSRMLCSSSPLSLATLRLRRTAERAPPASDEPSTPIVRSLAFGSMSSAETAAEDAVIAEEELPLAVDGL